MRKAFVITVQNSREIQFSEHEGGTLLWHVTEQFLTVPVLTGELDGRTGLATTNTPPNTALS